MSTNITVDTWIKQEQNALYQFNELVAGRVEEGIFQALTKTMRDQLMDDGKAKVELPWGTYSAEFVKVGDTANVTPEWEPSKSFMKLLNSDDDSREILQQDEFNEDFMTYLDNFTSFGFVDPEKHSDEMNNPNYSRGPHMQREEMKYLLNSYADLLANIAKDKQHNGKMLMVEINNGFPHGVFTFEYEDNEISVRFNPDKTFKQLLKDDEAAERAATADFHPVTGDRKEITPVKSDD